MPTLSVTTPVYNGAAFVDRCYHSLKAQTFTDWEWVVVDDGSTDSTAPRIRRIAERDGRVKLISYSPNRGRGFARTTAMQNAGGDWMVIWDIDDFYFPRRLEAIDRARREGYEWWASNVVVLDLALRFRGVRGFSHPFPPLKVRTPTHGAMACDLGLARRIGYDPTLTTLGQIGEDAAITYLVGLRHKGKLEDEPLMVNVIGNEVVLRKSIDSNGCRVALFKKLYADGVLAMPAASFRRLMAKERLRLILLHCLRVCPPLYPFLMNYRMRGDRVEDLRLSAEQEAFIDDVRKRFPPGGLPHAEMEAKPRAAGGSRRQECDGPAFESGGDTGTTPAAAEHGISEYATSMAPHEEPLSTR